MMEGRALVFVYNADSGFLNTLFDIGHKLVSPATYSCRLCSLTHSTFRMRNEWREFVSHLGVPVEFLHRDEFVERAGIALPVLPAIYQRKGDKYALWIDRKQIETCRSLDDLQQLIRNKN